MCTIPMITLPAIFRSWFNSATDPAGTPLSDFFDLDHLRIVLADCAAEIPAWSDADDLRPILAAVYRPVEGRFQVASFVITEATPSRLRIDLYDTFTLGVDGMTYVRDSQGIPETLLFDFVNHKIEIEELPMPEIETWNQRRDVAWLWQVLGKSAPSMRAA